MTVARLIFVICMLVENVSSADVAAEALRVLRDNCLRCHGEDKRKGGLALHSREALLAGGAEGPVVIGTSAKKSVLVQSLAADADPHMPPKKQLSKADVEVVARWVAAGLPWNGEALWELPAREVRQWQELSPAYHPVGALALAADGSQLAVARGRRIEVFDRAGKEFRPGVSLSGHRDVVQSLAWSPTGGILVSGGYRRVVVWNVADGKAVRELTNGFAGRITGLCFTRDGASLVAADSVASVGARLQVLKTKGWTLNKSFHAHADAVYDLSLSGDGKLLASASADRLVKLWSTGDWSGKGVLEGHTDYALASAFDPEGRRIATGSADATIKVWDVATRKQVSTFSDRRSELAITGLYWRRNPAAKKGGNDDWIISISEDGTPRLYTDLVVHDGAQRSTGARMKSWPAAAAGLATMTWDEGSGRLLAGDTGGGVTIWSEDGKVTDRIAKP